jgi:diguanylate cyclase (GGDEF)-like protein/PAS domain S-box-containing protein
VERDLMEPSFRRLMDCLYDGVYFLDRDRTIRYWNKAAEKITGFPADEVLGKRCSDNILSHVDEQGNRLCKSLCVVAKTIDDGIPREAEVFLHHKKGHRLPVAIRVNPVTDMDGHIIGGVELFTEISTRHTAAFRVRELEKLALLDPVTELANRRFAEMELDNRLQEQERYGWPFGVLLVDVDKFKTVNDTFGHQTGDALLRAIGKTMAKNARPFDIFGRWGGDEFIGLLKNVDAKTVYDIGRRLRLLIKEAFVTVDGKSISATISIGGTLARAEDTKEGILERADKLLYKSKAAGKNRFTMDLSGEE